MKDIAAETARATEDIGRRVDAIQNDSRGAASAMAQISQVIDRINSYQVTISSAVEEQTATVQEMSRGAGEAALASSAIAATIDDVASSSQVTTQGVTESMKAITELADMANELRTLVAGFRY